MDPIFQGKKLDDEVTAVKRHLQALANQQLKLKNDFVSPLSGRPRRVNVPQIELAEPPEPQLAITTDSSSSAPIPLTIKSLKPALVFNLDCGPTSTIAELKQQLASSANSAPPVDSQRWLYKGKALADNKLLKEYDAIKPNETIHLMIKPSSTMAPASNQAEVEEAKPSVLPSAPSSRSASISARRPSNPTLAMSIPKITMDSEGGLSGETPIIARSRSGSIHTNVSHSPHLGISESFRTVVTKSEFWIDLKNFLTEQFGPYGAAESNARQMWEHWFIASKEWMSASDIAKIREAAGISGMAGR